MSGTVAGGIKTRDVNRARYGQDFYRRIGAIGGQASTTGGFYANRELARRAGAKGGRKSSRLGVSNFNKLSKLSKET